MKKPALCCLFLLCMFAPAFAEPLKQGERDRALSELYASRKLFLDSVAGLSDAQWNFKPAPEVWSIAECAEHITLSEDLLMGVIQKALQGPAAPDKKAEVKGKDEAILKQVPDRSQKFKAPEALVPTHRWPTQQALIERFKESRDHTLDYVRSTQDDLRSHFTPHPVMGTLDAYQWLLLLSAHTQRHTAQLNEVKQNPGFPKE
jgi:DinB family protein